MVKKSIEADPANRKFGEKRDKRRWARNGETAEYLNVSVMTLYRWKHDPAYDFPRATKIDRMEFNDLDKVDACMEASHQKRGGRAMTTTIRRTRIGAGEIVTLKSEDPFLLRPYQTYAVTNGVCGRVSHFGSYVVD